MIGSSNKVLVRISLFFSQTFARMSFGSQIFKLALFLQLGNVTFYIFFLALAGYLPTPFIGDKNDTFMDFYHTAYWSMNDGRYTEWHSVYPPLVFLVLKFTLSLFPSTEMAHDGFHLRMIWPEGSLLLCAAYILSISGAVALWPRGCVGYKSWACWSLFFLLSPPALFALERGNVIVLLPPLIVLTLRGNKVTSLLAEALMINIKPYMALMLFTYIVKRDFFGFCQAIALNLLIYLISGVLIDSNFFEMLWNLTYFDGSEFLWSPSELSSMVASPKVLSYVNDFKYMFGEIKVPERFDWRPIANIPIIFCYAMVLIGIFQLIRFRDDVSVPLIRAFICVSIICCFQSAGSYSLIFFVAFIYLFLKNNNNFSALSVWIFILFCPIDLMVVGVKSGYSGFSFLSLKSVNAVEFKLLSSFIRPVILIIILALIISKIDTNRKKGNKRWLGKTEQVG